MRVTVTPNKELAAEIRAALKENDGYCFISYAVYISNNDSLG